MLSLTGVAVWVVDSPGSASCACTALREKLILRQEDIIYRDRLDRSPLPVHPTREPSF